jgi:hypothetical protein
VSRLPVSLRLFSCLLLLAVAGCSFSYSSESISNSISGSSNSSSGSSGGGGSDQSYRNDVRDYTATYVLRSGTDEAAFERGIAAIAKSHGVSNWEGERATWVGMGEGLAKAQLTPGEAEHYKQEFAGTDAEHASAIQQGYDQGRS